MEPLSLEQIFSRVKDCLDQLQQSRTWAIEMIKTKNIVVIHDVKQRTLIVNDGKRKQSVTSSLPVSIRLAMSDAEQPSVIKVEDGVWAEHLALHLVVDHPFKTEMEITPEILSEEGGDNEKDENKGEIRGVQDDGESQHEEYKRQWRQRGGALLWDGLDEEKKCARDKEKLRVVMNDRRELKSKEAFVGEETGPDADRDGWTSEKKREGTDVTADGLDGEQDEAMRQEAVPEREEGTQDGDKMGKDGKGGVDGKEEGPDKEEDGPEEEYEVESEPKREKEADDWGKVLAEGKKLKGGGDWQVELEEGGIIPPLIKRASMSEIKQEAKDFDVPSSDTPLQSMRPQRKRHAPVRLQDTRPFIEPEQKKKQSSPELAEDGHCNVSETSNHSAIDDAKDRGQYDVYATTTTTLSKSQKYLELIRVKISENGRLHCPRCSSTQKNRHSLVRHYRNEHKPHYSATDDDKNLDEFNRSSAVDSVLSCDNERPCLISNVQNLKYPELAALKIAENGRLHCPFCTKTFKNRHSLVDHYRTIHHGHSSGGSGTTSMAENQFDVNGLSALSSQGEDTQGNDKNICGEPKVKAASIITKKTTPKKTSKNGVVKKHSKSAKVRGGERVLTTTKKYPELARIRTTENGRLCCPVCSVTLRYRSGLIAHYREQHTGQPESTASKKYPELTYVRSSDGRLHCPRCTANFKHCRTIRKHFSTRHGCQIRTKLTNNDASPSAADPVAVINGSVCEQIQEKDSMSGIEKSTVVDTAQTCNDESLYSTAMCNGDLNEDVCKGPKNERSPKYYPTNALASDAVNDENLKRTSVRVSTPKEDGVTRNVRLIDEERPEEQNRENDHALGFEKSTKNNAKENHLNKCHAKRKKYNSNLYPELADAKSSESGRFHCPRCSTTLKNRISLVRHYKHYHREMKHNDGTGNLLCHLCDMRFHNDLYLKCHVRSVHRKRITCDHCDAEFSSYILLFQHKSVIHQDKLFPCVLCKKSFLSKQKLAKHMRLFHPDKEATFVCDYCQKSFITERILSYHIDEFHEHGSKDFDKPFACPEEFCQKRFRLESSAAQHATFHVPHTRYYSKRKTKKVNEVVSHTEGTELRDAELSPCPSCGKMFSAQRMNSHTARCQSLFKCNECDKSYATEFYLSMHHITKHLKIKVACPVEGCGKLLIKTTLQAHIKCVHENIRHQCNHCEKSFKIRSDLKQHIEAMHEGKKARCSFCDRDFVRRSEKNRHERQVHGAGKSTN